MYQIFLHFTNSLLTYPCHKHDFDYRIKSHPTYIYIFSPDRDIGMGYWICLISVWMENDLIAHWISFNFNAFFFLLLLSGNMREKILFIWLTVALWLLSPLFWWRSYKSCLHDYLFKNSLIYSYPAHNTFWWEITINWIANVQGTSDWRIINFFEFCL